MYDNFGNDGLSKLYRSGDFGRVLVSGHIHFMGRADDQVKILGHRVEIGSVEAVIRSCNRVHFCVVLPIAHSLVAFVVGDFSSEVSLVNELLQQLPSYEMPRRVIKLLTIPLTSAGKVDRVKLKSLVTDTEPTRETIQAHTPLLTLELLFHQFFGAASSEKSMWELGATSVTAVQFDEAVSNALGKRIGLAKMMRDGTLQGLSKSDRQRADTSLGGHS